MSRRPALLLIDFINSLDFDGGDKLVRRALSAARRTRVLKQRAEAEGVSAIYVNDNFGDWSANFGAVVRKCERSRLGKQLATLLRPTRRDLSILKPRHSAFYGTPLEFLLDELEVDSLVLTGLQAHICILFTAHDAFLRRYRLWVPRDCVASETTASEHVAISHIAEVTRANVQPSRQLRKGEPIVSAFAGGKHDATAPHRRRDAT